jgi:drug/metabolite transporter (DMT)-like permease
MTNAVKARLLMVALVLAWGLTWPAMRVALYDFPPFTMRVFTALIGALSLLVLSSVFGRGVRLPPKSAWGYIVIVSLFNIVIFSICTAFAQLNAMTGRVTILAYTMPIWVGLLSWLFLGERLNRARTIGLALCVAGMAVLIYPLAGGGIPIGLLLALGAAVSWALGTIYIKQSHVVVDPYALATWQLVVAFVIFVVLQVAFEWPFALSSVHLQSWLGVIFSGLFGSAIAYYIWFKIIRLVPAVTASLGSLSSPVIGVISSAFILNEWPTGTDIVGYSLIFSASVFALLQPQLPAPESPSAR